MSDCDEASPSPRSPDIETLHDSPAPNVAEGPDTQQKHPDNAPALDLKALTDRTLHFLATASNETLGACLIGLGAGTYLILGRVGLVLIGVVGGVVLHATWEGHTSNGGSSKEAQGKNPESRRRELGADIAQRVLDWRAVKAPEKGSRDDDATDLNVKLYSGMKLDYSDFQPETAAALTELTDAVIRDYVKYGLAMLSRYLSNAIQVVVLACPARRRSLSQFLSSDPDCLYAFRVEPPLSQTSR